MSLSFELGAADYITKPFSLAVLKARLGRWMGRKSAAKSLVLDKAEIDLTIGRIIYSGVETGRLARKELLTLRYLLANQGQVLSRSQILGFAWGYDYDGTPRTVDNTIASLCRKLSDAGLDGGAVISSHPGMGYSFELSERL